MPRRMRGGGARDGGGGEETPVRLYSFVFLSGTRKEEVNNKNIEGNTLLIPRTVDS